MYGAPVSQGGGCAALLVFLQGAHGTHTSTLITTAHSVSPHYKPQQNNCAAFPVKMLLHAINSWSLYRALVL